MNRKRRRPPVRAVSHAAAPCPQQGASASSSGLGAQHAPCGVSGVQQAPDVVRIGPRSTLSPLSPEVRKVSHESPCGVDFCLIFAFHDERYGMVKCVQRSGTDRHEGLAHECELNNFHRAGQAAWAVSRQVRHAIDFRIRQNRCVEGSGFLCVVRTIDE
jgi:hypothetical protein